LRQRRTGWHERLSFVVLLRDGHINSGANQRPPIEAREFDILSSSVQERNRFSATQLALPLGRSLQGQDHDSGLLHGCKDFGSRSSGLLVVAMPPRSVRHPASEGDTPPGVGRNPYPPPVPYSGSSNRDLRCNCTPPDWTRLSCWASSSC
jgi:hypothetical protein